MKTWVAALFTAVVTAIAATASAQGDAARGQQKAISCGACHGADGNSETEEWPKLAGIDEAYIVAQLRAFQADQRQDPLMGPQAMGLTEEDMHDLGAFYASKKMMANAATEADKALYEQGERIYKAGVAGKAVTACMVCHGPIGDGHPSAGFTRLAGQHAAYVAAQLLAFRAGDRSDPERMMPDVTAQMSDDEIRAVASYVSTLSGAPSVP
jgi:cytochrome c553